MGKDSVIKARISLEERGRLIVAAGLLGEPLSMLVREASLEFARRIIERKAGEGLVAPAVEPAVVPARVAEAPVVVPAGKVDWLAVSQYAEITSKKGWYMMTDDEQEEWAGKYSASLG
jgi:hypothetical protein